MTAENLFVSAINRPLPQAVLTKSYAHHQVTFSIHHLGRYRNHRRGDPIDCAALYFQLHGQKSVQLVCRHAQTRDRAGNQSGAPDADGVETRPKGGAIHCRDPDNCRRLPGDSNRRERPEYNRRNYLRGVEPAAGYSGRHWGLSALRVSWALHFSDLRPHHIFVCRSQLWKSANAFSLPHNRTLAWPLATDGAAAGHVRPLANSRVHYSLVVSGGRSGNAAARLANPLLLGRRNCRMASAIQEFPIYHLRGTIYYSVRVIQYSAKDRGLTFAVRIVPRASRSEITGEYNGALRIRIAALPVAGAANRELIRLLARGFKLPQSALEIVSGTGSKSKIVRLAGADSARLEQLTLLK